MEAYQSNYGSFGHLSVGVEVPTNSEELKINSVTEV